MLAHRRLGDRLTLISQGITGCFFTFYTRWDRCVSSKDNYETGGV